MEVEKRVEIIKEQALNNLRQQMQSSAKIESNAVVQLRGAEISKELEKILDSANRQVLIYSPWISRSVVNQKFIDRLQKLADKGVWILIGYGIAQSEQDEDRPIPLEVKKKLQSILMQDGIQAVQLFWLGGSHAKELIVDQKVHLLGSNNLLSFRASSGLWDESVYKVTISKQVQEAYDYYAKRFEALAQKLWNRFIKNQNVELAKQALYLWRALEMNELVLNHIESINLPELELIKNSIIKQG